MKIEVVQGAHSLVWDSTLPAEFTLLIKAMGNYESAGVTVNRGALVDLRAILNRALKETDAAKRKKSTQHKCADTKEKA